MLSDDTNTKSSNNIIILQQIEDCRDRNDTVLQFTVDPITFGYNTLINSSSTPQYSLNDLKNLLDDDLIKNFSLTSTTNELIFSAVNCSLLLCMRVLTSLRKKSWIILTSNAYLDIYTNCIVKTFYFEKYSQSKLFAVSSPTALANGTSLPAFAPRSNIVRTRSSTTKIDNDPLSSHGNSSTPEPEIPGGVSNSGNNNYPQNTTTNNNNNTNNNSYNNSSNNNNTINANTSNISNTNASIPQTTVKSSPTGRTNTGHVDVPEPVTQPVRRESLGRRQPPAPPSMITKSASLTIGTNENGTTSDTSPRSMNTPITSPNTLPSSQPVYSRNNSHNSISNNNNSSSNNNNNNNINNNSSSSSSSNNSNINVNNNNNNDATSSEVEEKREKAPVVTGRATSVNQAVMGYLSAASASPKVNVDPKPINQTLATYKTFPPSKPIAQAPASTPSPNILAAAQAANNVTTQSTLPMSPTKETPTQREVLSHRESPTPASNENSHPLASSTSPNMSNYNTPGTTPFKKDTDHQTNPIVAIAYIVNQQSDSGVSAVNVSAAEDGSTTGTGGEGVISEEEAAPPTFAATTGREDKFTFGSPLSLMTNYRAQSMPNVSSSSGSDGSSPTNTGNKNSEYFRKLKEAQDAEKQRQIEEESKMSAFELQKKREAEAEVQQHESSKTAHYARLGATFVNRGSPLVGGAAGRGPVPTGRLGGRGNR